MSTPILDPSLPADHSPLSSGEMGWLKELTPEEAEEESKRIKEVNSRFKKLGLH